MLNCTKDLELSDLIFKILRGKIIVFGHGKWDFVAMLF